MKQILVMMAAVVLVGQSVVADEKPLITDPIVEKAISIFEDKLTQADLEVVTSISLGGTKITDEGLKELAKLQKLKRLGLENTQITDVGLKEVAKLQKLVGLRVSFLNDTKITAEGVAELQKALPKCIIPRF